MPFSSLTRLSTWIVPTFAVISAFSPTTGLPNSSRTMALIITRSGLSRYSTFGFMWTSRANGGYTVSVRYMKPELTTVRSGFRSISFAK
ncbi:hypothetical protein D3C76_1326460 [compost metagenome]